MHRYGADCMYVTDTGGRLTIDDARGRTRAYQDVLDPSTQLGFNADRKPSLSWADSVVTVGEGGAYRVDASPAGHGTGAGNTSLEAFFAAAGLPGWEHKTDRDPGRRR
ncbi:hypothetical protein [Gordonia sp. C13]|uniref:hypothetical protein n=1 Tax=Gordonia sp. C13 TaxID=2935078 RepID=UPI0035A8C837